MMCVDISDFTYTKEQKLSLCKYYGYSSYFNVILKVMGYSDL